MKKLQQLWVRHSTRLAEARTERDLYLARIEELKREQAELAAECSELERTLEEAKRERSSTLRAALEETASVFSGRSKFYANLLNGDLFDAKKIKEEKEAISLYAKAQTEAVKRALQPGYEQALRNRQERQKAKSQETIEAGVVLHKKGEQKLDIYITAFTTSTGGLVDNLTRAVYEVLKASGIFMVKNNVGDLLRYTVEGDYQTLVHSLKELKPEGLKEAGVEYRVAILDKEKVEGKKRERKYYEVVEVDEIPPDYIHIAKAAEIAGFSQSCFYPYMGAGKVEGRKFNLRNSSARKPKMYINLASLEEFLNSRNKRIAEEASTEVVPSLSPFPSDSAGQYNPTE